MSALRAIFTNFGSRGDFQILLTLASELAGAGYDPCFALPEFARDLVNRAGFEFIPIGTDLAGIRDRINLSWSTQPDSYSSGAQLFDLLAPFQPHFAKALKQLAAACHDADVLISGAVQPLARILHEMTGIPFVSVQGCHFGGSGGPALREAGELLVNGFRREIGLPGIDDPLTSGANSPQLALYAMSAHLRPRPENWPRHHHITGFFFPPAAPVCDAALEKFLASGPAPVAFTFGSMTDLHDRSVVEILLEAARKNSCRVILQGFGSRPADYTDDENVHWAGFVPHSWLFRRAACIVLHGGAQTSAEVFRAGVPGIFVPHGDFFDQRYWAQMAHERGCSVRPISFQELTPARLADAIRETISSERLQSAVNDLAAKVRSENGVRTARRLIDTLIDKIGWQTKDPGLDNAHRQHLNPSLE